MEMLLSRLEQNYEVTVCDRLSNMLDQELARVIICDKAYSILKQDDNLFELAFNTPTTDGVQIPFQQSFSIVTIPNLTVDSVISTVAENSNLYLNKLLTNPLFSRHNISI